MRNADGLDAPLGRLLEALKTCQVSRIRVSRLSKLVEVICRGRDGGGQDLDLPTSLKGRLYQLIEIICAYVRDMPIRLREVEFVLQYLAFQERIEELTRIEVELYELWCSFVLCTSLESNLDVMAIYQHPAKCTFHKKNSNVRGEKLDIPGAKSDAMTSSDEDDADESDCVETYEKLEPMMSADDSIIAVQAKIESDHTIDQSRDFEGLKLALRRIHLDIECIHPLDLDEFSGTEDSGDTEQVRAHEFIRDVFPLIMQEYNKADSSLDVSPSSLEMDDVEMNLSNLVVGTFSGIWSGQQVEVSCGPVLVREEFLDIYLRELYHARTWKHLSHRNIQTLFGGCVLDTRVLWITEQGDRTLADVLEDTNITLNSDQEETIMKGVARGLVYLHEQGLLCNTLSPGTVTLSDHLRSNVKIKFTTQNKTQFLQTHPINTAPEVLIDQSTGWSTKSDAFAFGILCWQIKERASPWFYLDETDIRLAITNGERPAFGRDTPWKPRLQHMIEALWEQEPSSRPEVALALRSLEERVRDRRSTRVMKSLLRVYWRSSQDTRDERGIILGLLSHVGMDKYASLLFENNFRSLKKCRSLTHGDLRGLGVPFASDRDKIICVLSEEAFIQSESQRFASLRKESQNRFSAAHYQDYGSGIENTEYSTESHLGAGVNHLEDSTNSSSDNQSETTCENDDDEESCSSEEQGANAIRQILQELGLEDFLQQLMDAGLNTVTSCRNASEYDLEAAGVDSSEIRDLLLDAFQTRGLDGSDDGGISLPSFSSESESEEKATSKLEKLMGAIGSERYYPSLVTQGFYSIRRCKKLTSADLARIGVESGDRSQLLDLFKYYNSSLERSAKTLHSIRQKAVKGRKKRQHRARRKRHERELIACVSKANLNSMVESVLSDLGMERASTKIIKSGFNIKSVLRREPLDLYNAGIKKEFREIIFDALETMAEQQLYEYQRERRRQARSRTPTTAVESRSVDEADEFDDITMESNLDFDSMVDLLRSLAPRTSATAWEEFLVPLARQYSTLDDLRNLENYDLTNIGISDPACRREILHVLGNLNEEELRRIRSGWRRRSQLPENIEEDDAVIEKVLKSIHRQSLSPTIIARFGTVRRCKGLTHRDLQEIGMDRYRDRDRVISAFRHYSRSPTQRKQRSGSLKSTTSEESNEDSLFTMLHSLSMDKYHRNLARHGFDTLHKCKKLSLSDLKSCGIPADENSQKLLNALKLAASQTELDEKQYTGDDSHSSEDLDLGPFSQPRASMNRLSSSIKSRSPLSGSQEQAVVARKKSLAFRSSRFRRLPSLNFVRMLKINSDQ